MGLQLTRNVLATFNLLLSGLLTCLWLVMARAGNNRLHGVAEWVLLVSLVAMMLTSLLAAVHLMMHGTVKRGLNWNTAVSFCWLLGAATLTALALSNGYWGFFDRAAVSFLGAMGAAWLFFGWVVRQCWNLEAQKQALTGVALPVTPVAESVLTRLIETPRAALVVASQEAAPLMQAGRR